jgi:hypothetical protein
LRRHRRSAAASNCVHCGYSWRGLPAGHACPECGLPRDEHTTVVTARGPWGLSLLSVAALVLFAWGLLSLADIALAIFAILAVGIGGVIADVIEIVLLAAIGFWAVRFLFRIWTIRRYAAVTPEGIWVRSLLGERRVPWREFQYVQMNAFIPTIFAAGAEPYRVRMVGVFRDRAAFDRFDEAAEAAFARYRTGSPGAA